MLRKGLIHSTFTSSLLFSDVTQRNKRIIDEVIGSWDVAIPCIGSVDTQMSRRNSFCALKDRAGRISEHYSILFALDVITRRPITYKSSSKKSSMSNQTIWLGISNQNWFDATNWTKGVPCTNKHAFIPELRDAARYPKIDRNLKINYTIKNEGKLGVSASIYIMHNGLLQNYGEIVLNERSSVVNDGNVMNFGRWISAGTLANKKMFTNQKYLFNSGTIINENHLINIGTFENEGHVDNQHLINNKGAWKNLRDLGKIAESYPIADESSFETIFYALEPKAISNIR